MTYTVSFMLDSVPFHLSSRLPFAPSHLVNWPVVQRDPGLSHVVKMYTYVIMVFLHTV